MGSPKQLLDYRGRAFWQAVIEPLCESNLEGVLMVIQSGIKKTLLPHKPPQVVLAINDDLNSAMIDSVRLGLTHWSNEKLIQPTDGFLICPVDLPGLRATDINLCLEQFRQQPQRIVIATYQGKSGHPMIFPAGLVSFVHSNQCDQGLNALAKNHPEKITSLDCDNPAVIRNINNPVDYRRLTGEDRA